MYAFRCNEQVWLIDASMEIMTMINETSGTATSDVRERSVTVHSLVRGHVASYQYPCECKVGVRELNATKIL